MENKFRICSVFEKMAFTEKENPHSADLDAFLWDIQIVAGNTLVIIRTAGRIAYAFYCTHCRKKKPLEPVPKSKFFKWKLDIML